MFNNIPQIMHNRSCNSFLSREQ